MKVSAEADESNSCTRGVDEGRLESWRSRVNRRRSERIFRGGRRGPCHGQVRRDQTKKGSCSELGAPSPSESCGGARGCPGASPPSRATMCARILAMTGVASERLGVLDGGDDAQSPATVRTGLDVNLEHPLESLHPGGPRRVSGAVGLSGSRCRDGECFGTISLRCLKFGAKTP